MLLSAMVDNTVPSEIIYVEYRGQKGRIRQAAIKGLQRPTAVGLGFLTSRAPLGAPAPPGTGFPRLRPPRVESWRVSCGAQVRVRIGGVSFGLLLRACVSIYLRARAKSQ